MERLQQFFSGNWSMRRQDMDSLMSLLVPCILAGNIEEAAAQLNKDKFEAKVVSPYMAQTWELDDMTIPADSVAVIKLAGTLYVWETDKVVRLLQKAERNPSICGVVFLVDGPGGMVSHIDIATAAIENFQKPTATVVMGVMASAHFWLGTAADRIFAASPLCEVGSVGIVMTHYGYKKYFEMQGIDYREIYPDTADLKNRAVRDIDEKGDESLAKAKAETIHKVFCETVARNLGIKYDASLPIFRGEMFMTEEALAKGYVHEMGGVEDAVKWVLAKATSRKAEKIYN